MTATFDEIFSSMCDSMMEAEMENVALVYGQEFENVLEFADERAHPIDFKDLFAHCGQFENVFMRKSPEEDNIFEFIFFPKDHNKNIIVKQVEKPTVH